jgi:hypothetical protein
MPRKREKSRHVSASYGQETNGSVRLCDHPDCQEPAEHRAPRSRSELRDYFWFCLDHVRAYNAAWNYYSGMSEDEIEVELQKDTFWHRPTWPLGDKRSNVGHGRVGDPFGVFDDGPNGANSPGTGANGRAGDDRTDDEEYMNAAPSLGIRHTEALAAMDLRPPVTVIAIKARYKELVKRHHPDANGGSRRAEERLKTINIAYGSLMKALED